MDRKEITDIINYSKKLKVLYVEDNANARAQTSKMMETFFTYIDTAVDGKKGLEKFNQNNYDLIFSDINMPNMNGIEMFKNIREKNEEIPLVVITAHDQKEHFIESIEINVDSYILKPVNIEQFIIVLKKIVKKLKAFEENKNYKKEIEELNKDLEKKVALKTQQLKDKLYFDELTKVGSRYSLIESLSKLSKGDCGVLLSLKIDSFSIYNDLYSNKIGNKVLVEFGKILELFAKENSFKVFRSHGDNFLLYTLNDTCDTDTLLNYIITFEKFLKNQTIFLEEIKENITFSTTIGAAFGNDHILANANIALTKARKDLKKHHIYDSKIDTKEYLKNILYWKNELESALKEDRIEPYFQAIYDRNLNILKYESLVRINQYISKDKQNLVSPSRFLEISKTTKLYTKLSYTTIEKSLDIAIQKDISISINLAVLDIQSLEITNMLENKIRAYMKQRKSDSHNIILEILEDESIKDYDYVKDILDKFKDMGALIAIDDFGSGYSNLKHILELSPDYIKIDGSLIQEVNNDKKSKEIIKAIVLFAKTTGIKTIAEFVSDKDIYDIVFSLGIDEFQGYYLNKPKSSKEIN